MATQGSDRSEPHRRSPDEPASDQPATGPDGPAVGPGRSGASEGSTPTSAEPSTAPDESGAAPTWATVDPHPEDEPSAYHGHEVLRPPVFSTGRFEFLGPPPSDHPPDPVVPFVAPPVSRRRRSDWPVLVIALVIASVVMAGCCIAGYVLYASKGSPIQF